MTPQTISVIMPALNAEKFIAPALRSLLRERELSLDIVVVDDGSTDATARIVEDMALSQPSIRLIAGPRVGVSRARNAGIAAMAPQSRFVTFLDSDDHVYPGRIGRQLALLKANPGTGFVMGLVQLFERIDEETSVPVAGSRTTTVAGVSLAAALFARSLFDRFGGFDEEMQHGEDTDFFLRLLEAHVPYITETDVAVLYRRHETNMTNDIPATRRGFVDAIRRSLVRRRASGNTAEIGTLFKHRGAAEEVFRQ